MMADKWWFVAPKGTDQEVCELWYLLLHVFAKPDTLTFDAPFWKSYWLTEWLAYFLLFFYVNLYWCAIARKKMYLSIREWLKPVGLTLAMSQSFYHTTNNYLPSFLNPRIVYTVIPTCTVIKQTICPWIWSLIVMSHINLIVSLMVVI
jgi:hypothetical protein